MGCGGGGLVEVDVDWKMCRSRQTTCMQEAWGEAAAPPFSLIEGSQDAWSSGALVLWFSGYPPAGSGDQLQFLLHIAPVLDKGKRLHLERNYPACPSPTACLSFATALAAQHQHASRHLRQLARIAESSSLPLLPCIRLTVPIRRVVLAGKV